MKKLLLTLLLVLTTTVNAWVYNDWDTEYNRAYTYHTVNPNKENTFDGQAPTHYFIASVAHSRGVLREYILNILF